MTDSKPHSTLSDMLTKSIIEVVVFFRSDEDGMKRYEEFTADEFRGIFEQFEAACVERDRISREGVGAVLKWSERAERAEAALREIADLDSQRVQFAAVGGEGGVMRKIAREALNPMQDSA